MRGRRYREHVVRRLKKHLGDKFRTRIVEPIPVEADESNHPRFRDLQHDLLAFVAPQLQAAFRTRRYSEVLSLISLLKRSVSTVAACRQTLQTVMQRYEELVHAVAEDQETRRQRIHTLRDYRRKLERFGTIGHDEEQEQALLEVEDIAHQLKDTDLAVRRGTYRLRKAATVIEALSDLCDAADGALDEDPKPRIIAEQIRAIRSGCPKANVLVYTEYTDSQDAIADHLNAQKLGVILKLSGKDDEKTRQTITERFRTRDSQVLVSTDASAEGLNLHQRCHHLIHVELPWNPNRLEQRNGRIDRYGQDKDPIVRYLYLKGTFEERILLRLIAKYERQRKLLTFVPNTLGITSSTDASEALLVKSLMDDDAKLFKEGETLFDLEAPEETDPDDPAVKELLEEIERSLAGFREATRTHDWLGAAGMNADQRQVDAAEEATEEGRREAVDLARFVLDAVLLDGGSVEPRDGIHAITLPPDWQHGLDDIPGYDPDTHRILLTTDIDVMSDADDNPVGFLGRAHPLVRRALDRVRNISFGSETQRSQDRRVSAVEAPVAEPQLLFTFLGRVSSDAEREFERAVAVRVSSEGVGSVHTSPDEWAALAGPGRAISPRHVWAKQFAGWGDGMKAPARAAALEAFAPLAERFTADRTKALQAEKQDQEAWLQQRCADLVAEAREEPREAPTLFDQPAPRPPSRDWLTLQDPAERLAALGSDRSARPSLRTEADTVLRVYRSRIEDIAARLRLGEPEIIRLGLLMIVPGKGGKHGA